MHDENAVLKAMMEEFKHQLAESMSPRVGGYGEDEGWEEKGMDTEDSRFEPSFVSRVSGIGSPERETISSINHPAILWKELQLERKRSVMYRRECEGLRLELDALKEGGVVDKIGHRCMMLQLQVEELSRENVALTKIQKNQEKKLMSDEDLSQDWPIVMASLRQDLFVASDRAERSAKNAGDMRKRMKELERKVKEGERERENLEEVIRDIDQKRFSGGGGTESYVDLKSTINKLMNEVEEGRERERKRAASMKSFMVQRKRREVAVKKVVEEKDVVIEDFRQKLKDAEVDARQNILNMKELQRTLAKLAVGNMKITEVKGLLPGGGGLSRGRT